MSDSSGTVQWLFCPQILACKKKESSAAMELLCRQQFFYSIKCVNHERMYSENVRSSHWLLKSFLSQQYSKVIANNASKTLTHVRKKMQKPILHLRKESQFFAFFETLSLQEKTLCDRVSLE